jgi:hypothetical protein
MGMKFPRLPRREEAHPCASLIPHHRVVVTNKRVAHVVEY